MEPSKISLPFDPTRPWTTRGRHKGRMLISDAKGEFPILVLMENAKGEESVMFFTADGMAGTKPSAHDLINIPRELDLYLNWFADGPKLYVTAEDAEAAAAGSIWPTQVVKVIEPFEAEPEWTK